MTPQEVAEAADDQDERARAEQDALAAESDAQAAEEAEDYAAYEAAQDGEWF